MKTGSFRVYIEWNGPGVRDRIEHCINPSVYVIYAIYLFELTPLKLIHATEGSLLLPYHKQLSLLQLRHHRHSANKWRPTIHHIGITHSELLHSHTHGLGFAYFESDILSR